MLHQSFAGRLVGLSPLHAWHRAFGAVPGDEEYSEARSFGQVAHSVLLGGGDLAVIDAPDWRTAAARERRDEALSAGKTPILKARYQQALELAVKVPAALEANGCPALTGKSEATAIWRKNGIWCQSRLDHVIIPAPKKSFSGALIYDFKFTTTEATKRACERKFIGLGYDVQHAAYVEAIEHIYPRLRDRVKMTFVFVEVNPPHAIRVMPVGGTMRMSGMVRWAEAREKWAQYLEKYGTEKPWPGYADNGEPAECPAWALRSQQESLDTFNPEEGEAA